MRHGNENKRTGWNSKKLDLSDLLSDPSQAIPSSGSRRKQEIYILNGLNQRGSGIEGFPHGAVVKNLPAMEETRVRSLGWEGPLEKGMATHSVFLLGEFHGQWRLAGYSPWSRKQSDTTKRLPVSLSHLWGFSRQETYQVSVISTDK